MIMIIVPGIEASSVLLMALLMCITCGSVTALPPSISSSLLACSPSISAIKAFALCSTHWISSAREGSGVLLQPRVAGAVDYVVTVFLDAGVTVQLDGSGCATAGPLGGDYLWHLFWGSIWVSSFPWQTSVCWLWCFWAKLYPPVEIGPPSDVGWCHCQRVLLHLPVIFPCYCSGGGRGGASHWGFPNLNLQGSFHGQQFLEQLMGTLLPNLVQAMKLPLCLAYSLPHSPEMAI